MQAKKEFGNKNENNWEEPQKNFGYWLSYQNTCNGCIRKGGEKGEEKILNKITAENHPNVLKNNLHIWEAQHI